MNLKNAGMCILNVYTVKTENCAVVLLYCLMDDTPTIMWIFCGYLCVFLCTKNAGVPCFLLCGKPLPACIE